MLIAILFLTSCSGSPDLGKKEAPKKDEVLSSFTQEDDCSSDASLHFSEEGLSRIREYLTHSLIALENSARFCGAAEFLELYYDWKRTPETSKAYLKGGEEDPLGKLLTIITVNHYHREAYEGLLELFNNKALLKEIIDYFTSSTFASEEIMNGLKEAITKKDLNAISQNLDGIYLRFSEYYGQYYHVNSKWAQKKEAATASEQLEPVGSGLDEDQKAFFIEKQKMKLEFTPGGIQMKPITIPSDVRIQVVAFITQLIQKYYNIPTPKKSE